MKLWIFAFGQAFFSLSVAGNGTVIYGSYLGKDENVVKSARNIEGVQAATVNTINVYDILKYDTFVITTDAVKKVEEVYA